MSRIAFSQQLCKSHVLKYYKISKAFEIYRISEINNVFSSLFGKYFTLYPFFSNSNVLLIIIIEL